MSFEGVPWMVNGAKHSADIGRIVADMAGGGETVIRRPGDLLVTALPVPGAFIRIRPGTALVQNLYPGGDGQSYVVRNVGSTDFPVPATGSSGGRTFYVIVRVEDPQYGGQPPTARGGTLEDGPYVYPVLVDSLPTDYPYIKLAKIVQPASTATITQSMITDIREIAPKERTRVRPLPLVAGDTGLDLTATGADGELWPNTQGEQYFDIPSWATRVQIRAEWLGVKITPGSGWGEIWAEYGPYLRPSTRREATQRFAWDADTSSDTYRADFTVHDDIYVPKDLRGTSQLFYMKGRVGAAKTPKLQMDNKSGIVLTVRFLQEPDPSTDE